MPTEHTIYFAADGYRLAGTLHLPDTPNPPVIIGCHGLLANRHSPKQISLASACNQKGLAYFRFDHRGCGDSQGEFGKVTTLAARRQDLYHAVQTMQDQSQVGPITALFGSSFGGTAVLAYAAKHPSPALITYAAPINSTAIHHDNIRDNNGQSPSAALLTDALTFDITSDLKAAKNILVAHSHNDETVPVEHAYQIYETAKDPKKKLIFEGGDHRMSNATHQKHFEKIFVEWIIQTH
jgi:alpha-beta hydrolase superfamily lysophospholipase